MINYRSLFRFFSILIFTLVVGVRANEAAASAGGSKSVPFLDVQSGDTVVPTEDGKVKDRVEGDVNAPVTIIEYASLTCIHCADFYNQVLPKIRKKYIETGKVKLIFRAFSFDPRSTAGFMLAGCAPEDRYFPLIEVLFQKQSEWAWQKDALTPLRKIAAMAGFSDEDFNNCLKNQSVLSDLNRSSKRGRELGVVGVPTFFINSKKYEGSISVEALSSEIDSFLSK